LRDTNENISIVEMEQLFVIKIGGNIIDDEAKLTAFLKEFARVFCPL
jgi:hypothetical protein